MENMSMLPKKESPINRIMGFDEEDQESLQDFFKEDWHTEKKIVVEKEHTKEFDETLISIYEKLNFFLEQFSVSLLPMSPENILILDYDRLSDEDKERVKGQSAFYAPGLRRICINSEVLENAPKLYLYRLIVHEILHTQSFQSIKEFSESKSGGFSLTYGGDERQYFDYTRIGFTIKTREDEYYFDDINEAITEALAQRFDWMFSKEIPALHEDAINRETIMLEYANKTGESVEQIQKKYSNFWRDKNSGQMFTEESGYMDKLDRLHRLVRDLYEKNTAEFNSEEEAFKIFTHAYFSKSLLGVARLIEKTYGKGSFRSIGKHTKR